MIAVLRHVKHADNFTAATGEHAEDGRDFFVFAKTDSHFVEDYMNGKKCISIRQVESFAGRETQQYGFLFQALQRTLPAHSKMTGKIDIARTRL